MSGKRPLFPDSSDSDSDSDKTILQKLQSQNKAQAQEEKKLFEQFLSPIGDNDDLESSDGDSQQDLPHLPVDDRMPEDLLPVDHFSDAESDDDYDDDNELFYDFPGRPECLSEEEATLLPFIGQTLFTLTDKAAVFVGNVANASSSGTNRVGPLIRSTHIRTMKRRVLSLFNPQHDKYFYANCGKALVGPFNERNKKVPQTCNLNHPECTINDSCIERKNGRSYFCCVSMKQYLDYVIPPWFDKLRLGRTDLSAAVGRPKLHDLKDGTRYRELVPEFPEDGIQTLTLTLGWDGVQYTDDGKSLWPLVVYLNELPYNERIKLPMLVAVHVGETPKDADQDLMLQPFIDEIVPFAKVPIQIVIKGVVHRFRVKLLLAVADGPARAKLKNCHGHQGIYGMF